MAQLPDFRTLTVEGLGKDLPDWVSDLISAWNANGQAIYNALNHQITGTDNQVWQRYPPIPTAASKYGNTSGYYNFTTSKTYTSAGTFAPFSFIWNFPQNYFPNEVRVGYLQPTNNTIIKSPVSLSWSYNAQKALITVNYIAGLTANTSYNLTLVIE